MSITTFAFTILYLSHSIFPVYSIPAPVAKYLVHHEQYVAFPFILIDVCFNDVLFVINRWRRLLHILFITHMGYADGPDSNYYKHELLLATLPSKVSCKVAETKGDVNRDVACN